MAPDEDEIFKYKVINKFFKRKTQESLRSFSMNSVSRRGAFIVLEGCDRVGKTTHSQHLLQSLKRDGQKAELIHFPDRTTNTGFIINHYLEHNKELEDHCIHLLFSANRWELVPRMMEMLNSGTILIADRYAYSGAAYSAAKEGLDLDWCKQSDSGLPRPDLVIFLDLTADVASERDGYGNERYEKSDFQSKVRENFFQLKEDNWKIINANQPVTQLQIDIKSCVDEIAKKNLENLQNLWPNNTE